MAVIKYRQTPTSPWTIYNGLTNVLGAQNYEYVKISTGTNKAAFPDLSLYVKDLGQIVAMTWCTDDGNYIYFNSYFRGADNGVDGRNIAATEYQVIASATPTTGISYSAQGYWSGTLTGTPSAINFGWSASRSTNFRGDIIIYYEGDEA